MKNFQNLHLELQVKRRFYRCVSVLFQSQSAILLKEMQCGSNNLLWRSMVVRVQTLFERYSEACCYAPDERRFEMSTNIGKIICEDSLILKKRLLHICDKNLIPALLLNEFENDNETEAACADMDNRDEKIWLYTNNLLTKRLYFLASPDEIYQACLFLANKKFISIWWYQEDDTATLPTRLYYVKYNRHLIEMASKPYLEEMARLAYERELNKKPLDQPPSANPPKARKIKLEDRYKTEASRVAMHNSRAAKVGLPATLTLQQWLSTLDHFKWTCAYCQGKYTVIEHFIPLTHGKGTEKDNCVPACYKCNSQKGTYHPSQVTDSQLILGIEKVYKYIASLEKEVTNHE